MADETEKTPSTEALAKVERRREEAQLHASAWERREALDEEIKRVQLADATLLHERRKVLSIVEDTYLMPQNEAALQEKRDRHEEHAHLRQYRDRHAAAVERLVEAETRQANAFERIASALERMGGGG